MPPKKDAKKLKTGLSQSAVQGIVMPVVHCKKNPYDVYIGRPGKWGNPFTIGKDGTREEVILKYENWIKTRPHLIAALPELKGKILGCWCSPQACHGDILSQMATKA